MDKKEGKYTLIALQDVALLSLPGDHASRRAILSLRAGAGRRVVTETTRRLDPRRGEGKGRGCAHTLGLCRAGSGFGTLALFAGVEPALELHSGGKEMAWKIYYIFF